MSLLVEPDRKNPEKHHAGTPEPTFELLVPNTQEACIKVIGVGGGGGNATQRMVESQINNVEFICVNTDAQALQDKTVGNLVQIGRSTTKGLGAGANPDIGRQAAQESREDLAGLVEGADMLFITAGMGGGTGTGAAPVIAELAREREILTVAVVTRPFTFEGARRSRIAEQGIAELRQYVDSVIIIPNDRLMELGKDYLVEDAFAEADRVLYGAVRGISDLITCPGLINVDFADVRTVMTQQGAAMMGTGEASGENRAVEATRRAMSSRLLEDVEVINAKGMLVNITTKRNLTMSEYQQIADLLTPMHTEDATVVVGTAYSEDIGDKLQVTIVVAGFDSEEEEESQESAGTPELTAVETASDDEVEGRIRDRIRRLHDTAKQPPEAVPEMGAQVAVGGSRQTAVPAPDWNNSKHRERLDIPAYLRAQHD